MYHCDWLQSLIGLGYLDLIFKVIVIYVEYLRKPVDGKLSLLDFGDLDLISRSQE